MYSLSFHSATTKAFASSLPNQPQPSQPSVPNVNVPAKALPRKQSKSKRRTPQPSIIQIERAIGAGMYRDADAKDLDERKSVFNGLTSTSEPKFESPVEKKLRETGEWITTETEEQFRSSGKRILLVIVQWILPIWAFSLLIASGIIKLPFSTPFLDDLIM